MKKFVLAGAAAALLMASAGAASAAVVVSFDPGPAHSPTSGYTVIDNFDTAANISGAKFQIANSWDGNGAPPANSVPFDTNYLSVLGGGGAAIVFSDLTGLRVTSFEFDWGSIDHYNSLAIHYTDAGGAEKDVIVPGTSKFPDAADGNQYDPGTNGLFVVTGTAGETFDGIVLTSGTNSFEIDNLAIAVPEPSVWAMMLLGLGGLGAALRARRKTLSLA
jgi:hypothetical protein